jgi:hypothetical protein
MGHWASATKNNNDVAMVKNAIKNIFFFILNCALIILRQAQYDCHGELVEPLINYFFGGKFFTFTITSSFNDCL